MVSLDPLTSLTGEFMQRFLVAALPSNQRNGATAFATDGRRSGESAGNGTGVPVWFDETNSRWNVFRDDSAVAA